MFRKSLSVFLAVLMLCAVVPLGTMQAFAVESAEEVSGDYTQLELDQTVTATVTKPGEIFMLEFTPAESRSYAFYSESEDDTYGYLYNSEMTVLTGNDDGGSGNNFKITYSLTAGATYYIGVKFYSDDKTGDIPVVAEAVPFAQSITVSPQSHSGYAGTYVQLEYEYSPADTEQESVTWSTSDASVATVDNYGYVSLIAAGTADITATSARGLTSSCAVTVKSAGTITPGEAQTVTLGEGDSVLFRFVAPETREYVFYSTGDGDTYGALYSENMSVLNYSDDDGDGSNFLIRTYLTKDQTYYWMARFYDSNAGSFTVMLEEPPYATSFTVAQAPVLKGFIGYQTSLTPVFAPEGAVTESITWTSSDPGVATVDSTGYVRMKAVGTTHVTAVSERGLSTELDVQVLDYIPLTLNEEEEYEITEPGSYAFFSFTPTASGGYDFSTASNIDNCFTYGVLYDENMVQLSYQNGESTVLRYALEAGKTYYYRTGFDNDQIGTILVTVGLVPSASSMVIDQGATIEGYRGNCEWLTVSFFPEGSMTETVSWSSSDNSVATVNEYGEVTFVDDGTAVITATSQNGLTALCNVTVLANPTIAAGEEKTAVISSPGATAFFTFVPSESGKYIFESLSETDTYGVLYDEEMNLLASDDESGEGNNFRIYYDCIAGTEYIIGARYYSTFNTGSFTVKVSKNIAPTGLKITQGETFTATLNTYKRFTAEFLPEGATSEPLTWQTTDSDVAVCTDDTLGVFSFNATGTATVTATSQTGLVAECVVTVTGCEDIAEGERKSVIPELREDTFLYRFVPSETTTYIYYSTGSSNTVGVVYDENMKSLYSAWDGGADLNFKVVCRLEAGKTYYLETCFEYGSDVSTDSVIQIEKTISATGMTLSPDSIEDEEGTYYNLTPQFTPEGAQEESVEWSSSNNSVASVNSGGEVWLRSPGTAVITATSENGLTATCTVTVNEIYYEPLAAGDTKTSTILTGGQTVVYKITPEDDAAYTFYSTGNGDTIAYLLDSTMTQLASDDEGGYNNNFRLQYLLEGGKTYYLSTKYWSSTVTGEFDVTCEVAPFATSVSFDRSSVEGCVGLGNAFISLSADPEGAYIGAVEYESSDTSVVSITEYTNALQLDFVSEGTATVTATTDAGLTATCTVNVIEPELLTLNVPKEGTIAESDSSKLYRFVPETSGYYLFTSHADNFFHGYLRSSDGRMISNQGSGDGSFRVKGYLEAGNTYYLETRFEYSGVTGDFDVLVEPGVAVTGLEIVTPPDKLTYYEGYVSQVLDLSGMVVQLTWTDGVTTVWNYDGDMDALRGETVSCYHSDGQIVVYVDGESDTWDLDIIENPVASISVTGTLPEFVENTDGYWSTRTDDDTGQRVDYFEYDLYSCYGTEVTVYFKDGTQAEGEIGDNLNGYYVDIRSNQHNQPFTLGENAVTVSYLGVETTATLTVVETPVQSVEILDTSGFSCIEECDGYWTNGLDPETGEYDRRFFYYYTDFNNIPVRITYKNGTVVNAKTYETVDGHDVRVTHDQYTTPWTVGGENPVTVSFMGCSAQASVTITPNPVSFITLPEGASVTLIENSDGYKYTDNGEEFFYYYSPDVSDIPVEIHYTDGTVKTAKPHEKVGDYYVETNNDQYNHPWTKGGENFITIKYMGREAELPVLIADSPVSSIEVTSDPTYEYVYGDGYYGGVDDFYPDDLTGLAFTVHFKDGTSKSYTGSDIEEGRIDGHVVMIESVYDEQTIGNNPFTLSYLGASATINVTVVENNVSSIEMTRLPDNTVYSQYYFPDWIGAQVKVTYKNGTSTTVTLEKDDIRYSFFGMRTYFVDFDIDGITARIAPWYEYGENEITSRYFRLFFVDKHSDITGMDYQEDKEVVGIEVEDFSATGENMLVKATYFDGTTESLRLTDICTSDEMGVADVVYFAARTPKGLLPYRIITATDIDPDVYVFGQYFDVDGDEEFLRGDVDGDGVITVDDVTTLQRYLAEFPTAGAARILRCGDINNDGKINIRDVSALQRYLAEYGNPYHIGQETA